jgi:hypothetical protein
MSELRAGEYAAGFHWDLLMSSPNRCLTAMQPDRLKPLARHPLLSSIGLPDIPCPTSNEFRIFLFSLRILNIRNRYGAPIGKIVRSLQFDVPI